jgi:hypothetical protein
VGRYQVGADPPKRIIVALVSVYLLLVGTALALARRVPSSGFLRTFAAVFRPPYEAQLSVFRPEQGHCFLADVPKHLLSDSECVSRLRLYEDDHELGPAHSLHEDIRARGSGAYSHWGSELYFSTSDNSDPRTNGYRYRIREASNRP